MAPMDNITRAHSAPAPADESCTDSERGQSPSARAEEAGAGRAVSLENAPRRFVKAHRNRRRSISGPDDEMDCMFAAMSYAALAAPRSTAPPSRSSSVPSSQWGALLKAQGLASTGEPDASEEQNSANAPELPPLHEDLARSPGGLGKRLLNDPPMEIDGQLFKRCTSSAEAQRSRSGSPLALNRGSPLPFGRLGASADSSSIFSAARTLSTSALPSGEGSLFSTVNAFPILGCSSREASPELATRHSNASPEQAT
ncbi:hypothetical protein T484DRAFT_1959217 [Baffinella frigidus]|nr:hypothetical protein T484DRAFT_1959217 [Cryptophyta sp. CCMP2293]